MSEALIWIVLVAGLIASILIPQYLIAKTARQVIADMKAHNAIGIDNAVTRAELNLEDAPFAVRMVSMKNYRPKALTLLLKLKVVKFDDDGRVYLDAAELANSGL